MDDYIVVVVTAASVEEAERIARALVDGGAAPCVNIVPAVVSIYRWKGETMKDAEACMLIKARSGDFQRIRDIVEANHTYEVPEVIAVPLAALSERYRAYLDSYFNESA